MLKVVHENVICKECPSHSSYITGWRHKCLMCPEYDLCEICFKYTRHEESHPFVTLKRQANFTPLQLLKPLLAISPYKKDMTTARQESSFSLFDMTSKQMVEPPSMFSTSFTHPTSRNTSGNADGFSFFGSQPLTTGTFTTNSTSTRIPLPTGTSPLFSKRPVTEKQETKGFDFGMDIQ